jgi:hypothetical protein
MNELLFMVHSHAHSEAIIYAFLCICAATMTVCMTCSIDKQRLYNNH